MKVVVLVALISLAAASPTPKNSEQKIIGGSLATIKQWPMTASLLYNWYLSTFWQSCGGAIINNRSILSAAHCLQFDKPEEWKIRLGSNYANSGGIVYTVDTIIIHPSYDAWTRDGDIAILQSRTIFEFSSTIAPGNIAGTLYVPVDNSQVYAIGWGLTAYGGAASEHLREVQIWTVNQNTCRTRYAERDVIINDNMLCSGWLDVGGRDQCHGDSGGPLFHSGVIVGVYSFAYQCALAYYPGVNTRVSRYTVWIQDNA